MVLLGAGGFLFLKEQNVPCFFLLYSWNAYPRTPPITVWWTNTVLGTDKGSILLLLQCFESPSEIMNNFQSKNTKSGSLCNVGGQLRIDDSYSTSRSRITLVIDWFKTLNKARYHNDGNVNQLSACSFLSRMAAVSSSVKYWRAILDCTFTVGPLGFGRCVSTALIGSVYLWEAVRNQTGSRKRPEQLTSLHHNHTLWESIWLLCVGVFWYRVNLPEANCGNRHICDWKMMWTCKWDDMTCNWPTDNEESPVRVRRR